MTDTPLTRRQLEAKAQALGVTFAKNIGDAKLAERVAAAEAAQGAGQAPAEGQDQGGGDTVPSGQDTASAPPADTEAPQTEKGEADAVFLVAVSGPLKGRWRAGLKFTSEPRELVVGEDISTEDLAAIEADPVLSVVVLDHGAELVAD